MLKYQVAKVCFVYIFGSAYLTTRSTTTLASADRQFASPITPHHYRWQLAAVKLLCSLLGPRVLVSGRYANIRLTRKFTYSFRGTSKRARVVNFRRTSEVSQLSSQTARPSLVQNVQSTYDKFIGKCFKKLKTANGHLTFHSRLTWAPARDVHRGRGRTDRQNSEAEKMIWNKSPKSEWDTGVPVLGAFKLDHLQPVKQILFKNVSTFLPRLP